MSLGEEPMEPGWFLFPLLFGKWRLAYHLEAGILDPKHWSLVDRKAASDALELARAGRYDEITGWTRTTHNVPEGWGYRRRSDPFDPSTERVTDRICP